MFKEQKGITLIALVITIIVLLILAGVTIAMLSGNDSAPKKAQEAAQATKVSEQKEQAALDVVAKYTTYMEGKYASGTPAVTAKNFTTYLNTLKTADEGANALGKNSTSYTVEITSAGSGDNITYTVTLTLKDDTSVRGTVSDGGSISWNK